MSWSLSFWELACLLSRSTAIEGLGKDTSLGKGKLPGSRERQHVKRPFFSTLCLLCSLAVPSVNIHVPLVIILHAFSQQQFPKHLWDFSVHFPFSFATPSLKRKAPSKTGGILFNIHSEKPEAKNRVVGREALAGVARTRLCSLSEKQLCFCQSLSDMVSWHPPHWLLCPSEMRHLAAGSCYNGLRWGAFPWEDFFQWQFWSASLLSPNLYHYNRTCHAFVVIHELFSWKMLSKCSYCLEKWTPHCFQINAVGTFYFLRFFVLCLPCLWKSNTTGPYQSGIVPHSQP